METLTQHSVLLSPSPNCSHRTAGLHVYINSRIPRRSASQQSQENLTQKHRGEKQHAHTSPISDLGRFVTLTHPLFCLSNSAKYREERSFYSLVSQAGIPSEALLHSGTQTATAGYSLFLLACMNLL